MGFSKGLPALVLLAVTAPGFLSATVIREVFDPPPAPGNSLGGTFFITPTVETWAFGVGNEAINDTSISGVRFINGLEANDHWISSLISRDSWDSGFNFDSIRPIGAAPPSSFSIDTTNVAWQWGGNEYVAFYWLSEADNVAANATAVLQPGVEYDAFRFFTSAANSPFAAFSAPNGGAIITGETIVERTNEVPEPGTLALLALGLLGIGLRRLRKQSS
jgi:hypothetical protein